MPPDPLEGEHALHVLSALLTLYLQLQNTGLVTNMGPYNFLPCYAPEMYR